MAHRRRQPVRANKQGKSRRPPRPQDLAAISRDLLDRRVGFLYTPLRRTGSEDTSKTFATSDHPPGVRLRTVWRIDIASLATFWTWHLAMWTSNCNNREVRSLNREHVAMSRTVATTRRVRGTRRGRKPSRRHRSAWSPTGVHGV